MDIKQREEYEKIGARIREARRQRQMSQADLAEKTGISLPRISIIENGKTTLKLSTFIRIIEVLQISADSLLRSDVPVVNSLYQSEFAKLLEDCSPSEKETILKVVKEVKRGLQSTGKTSEY